ncbi:MAG: cytochrome c biogenesis protein CcsA [Actinobacteria bacterium]|nr:cytochrome c biogenesis protein CcsA [Actinomycetota bacterium]
MLALLGMLGVSGAALGAGLLVVRGARAARPGGGTVDLGAPTRLLLSGAVVAMAAMQLALATDDLTIAYLANHHATTTPFPFDVATAWAALEGSILLWGLVLAGFTWMVHKTYRRSPDELGAAALAVLGLVALFFFGLMLTVANPFEVCVEAVERGCVASTAWPLALAEAPLEGPGPNPLLQNHILMAFHPPMLYLGFVGLTVPYAYAMAALALTRPGAEWLRRSHRSTLVAWSFLTMGIVLGGWWAYEVLSWGGYWAWDPVENASFMPWLVATAFIHSGLVQQRRGMLQAWNLVLVIGAFALTILGTFLTRSGTINSVHSFTQSAIGPVLLVFLVAILTGSFLLFSQRSHMLVGSPRVGDLVSREGAFLANNMILTVFAFVVLIGTTYPLVLEAFTGTRVGVGGPFFNRLAVPLSFLLLLVMGFGPITPWTATPPGLIWRRTRAPGLIALGAGLLTALTVTRIGWVVLAVVLGVFVVAIIVGLLLEQAARRPEPSLLDSLRSVVGGDPGFWSGQLSHVGVVLVALGIAFAANLGDHLEVDMAPGETVAFAGYTVTYTSPFQETEPGRTTRGARLQVGDDAGRSWVMEPAANYFGADTTGVSTPAVRSRPSGDLYVTLLALSSESATITFDTSPMIWLLWVGGLITAGGGVLSIRARGGERRAAALRQTADV